MAGSRPRVLIVAGTRPEAITLAPAHAALVVAGVHEPALVATAQHRELLVPVPARFGLAPVPRAAANRLAGRPAVQTKAAR